MIGLVPRFEGVLVGQFIWGVGFTLMSGATEAWLADQVGETAAASQYPRAAQWRQAATVFGVVAGAGLGVFNPQAPWVIGGLGHAILGGLLFFTMTEALRPARRRRGSPLGAVWHVATTGLGEARRQPVIRTALGVRLLFGAMSEMFSGLWGYHLLAMVASSGLTRPPSSSAESC